MKDKMRWIATILLVIIVFLIALAIVSMIPEGQPGVLYDENPTVYLTESETISEYPYFLFEDPEVEVCVVRR